MADKDLKVGIGDMKFTRGDSTIITYALGSCIGITFYDPFLKLGCLLHIMLPNRTDPNDPKVFKYADSGIRVDDPEAYGFRYDEKPDNCKDCRRSEDV